MGTRRHVPATSHQTAEVGEQREKKRKSTARGSRQTRRAPLPSPRPRLVLPGVRGTKPPARHGAQAVFGGAWWRARSRGPPPPWRRRQAQVGRVLVHAVEAAGQGAERFLPRAAASSAQRAAHPRRAPVAAQARGHAAGVGASVVGGRNWGRGERREGGGGCDPARDGGDAGPGAAAGGRDVWGRPIPWLRRPCGPYLCWWVLCATKTAVISRLGCELEMFVTSWGCSEEAFCRLVHWEPSPFSLLLCNLNVVIGDQLNGVHSCFMMCWLLVFLVYSFI